MVVRHLDHERRDPDSSAEWIAEAPCCTAGGAPLPLSQFGKVAFTGAGAATGGAMEPVPTFTADTLTEAPGGAGRRRRVRT